MTFVIITGFGLVYKMTDKDKLILFQRGCEFIRKDRESCTDEEKERWDQYAKWLANKIAYDEFRGVPSMKFIMTECYAEQA